MEEEFKHVYQMSVEELELLLRKVNFTNTYYADCYYGAYELGANPHEALWYLDRFTEWVDEQIADGELTPDSEGVWDWMRKVTANDVAMELEHFLCFWDDEGHKTIVAEMKTTPVRDYFYPWNEDARWRDILKCWERNEKQIKE